LLFFSSRRRHTRLVSDWSSDVCSSDLHLAAAPFIEHSTTLTGVPLAPDGDFKIDDVLVPMPDDCASPVLLIRSANGGNWFAAGKIGRASGREKGEKWGVGGARAEDTPE